MQYHTHNRSRMMTPIGSKNRIWKGLAVLAFIWFTSLFFMSESSRKKSAAMLRKEILDLSSQYVRQLSEELEDVDNFQPRPQTAHDLSRPLAVIINTLMKKIEVLEHELNITLNETQRLQSLVKLKNCSQICEDQTLKSMVHKKPEQSVNNFQDTHEYGNVIKNDKKLMGLQKVSEHEMGQLQGQENVVLSDKENVVPSMLKSEANAVLKNSQNDMEENVNNLKVLESHDKEVGVENEQGNMAKGDVNDGINNENNENFKGGKLLDGVDNPRDQINGINNINDMNNGVHLKEGGFSNQLQKGNNILFERNEDSIKDKRNAHGMQMDQGMEYGLNNGINGDAKMKEVL